MGIQGLKKLISDNAPGAFRDHQLESYFGRKVAIDASMHIYQFMAVVGRQGDQQLTDENGEVTSHLQGMMHRTTRLLEAGIKPVYVFDGKPPEMKSGELTKRSEARKDADQKLKEAKEAGDMVAVEKFSKRTMRVTKEHNEECKRLLRLMGVPILEAPCEAEAQCAELCKAGKVFTVATEDMDCLTFGTTRQSRHMMAPASQKKEIQEFVVEKVLEGMNVTMDQFIDICILCGCDYTSSIRGIGPKRALQLIREHGSLEKVIDQLDKKKYTVPEPFPYKEARELFKNPEVIPADQVPPFKWTNPDEEGLIAFMVDEKSFNLERIQAVIKKIKASKTKSQQGRLESFFGAVQYRSNTAKKQQDTKSKGLNPFGKSTGVTKKKKSSGIRLG
ncbi:XPG/Rad2 endonuclease [Chloropicon primus]|uniref:Flap endonuclease 1 n=1 Tax=Chloropicon primus TaxID=1764295 RepID=A0A5B8MLE4_9CHLO|nr:XPG/Rad2 endonuclease [Chloropicon primus]UPR00532.1 XPG/Rad2 endonuclease [Chloropicon primus]|eukprot:QDZ21316.1 XPG/Rad2 endonuclease [Chloropicon primus]